MANPLRLYRNETVGFIEWLDGCVVGSLRMLDYVALGNVAQDFIAVQLADNT